MKENAELEQEAKKTERCLLCYEPIYPASKKCNSCGSYQDWRRFFDFSAIILSLLIALISVTSALGPRLLDLLETSRSEIEVTGYYPTADGIALALVNNGTRPGQVGNVRLVLWDQFLAFKKSDLTPEQQKAPDWKNRVWGVDLDLGTSRGTSRTIPAKSSKELPFLVRATKLREISVDFPQSSYAGDFVTALYDESIRFEMTAEIIDYGKSKPHEIRVPTDLLSRTPGRREHPKGDAFYRLYDAITSGSSDLEIDKN